MIAAPYTLIASYTSELCVYICVCACVFVRVCLHVRMCSHMFTVL